MKGGADDVHERSFHAVAQLDVGVGPAQLLCRPLRQSQLGRSSPCGRGLLRLLLQILQTWKALEFGIIAYSLKCIHFGFKVDFCSIFVSAEAVALTGDEGVDISGFGGHVGCADLADLHQQSCHVVVKRREGLAEAHQAGQDGHEERVPLGPGQH